MATSFAANATGKLSKQEKEQLYCLSQNVYFEARGENTAGQLAVAMVTMNRVFHLLSVKLFGSVNSLAGPMMERVIALTRKKPGDWLHKLLNLFSTNMAHIKQ